MARKAKTSKLVRYLSLNSSCYHKSVKIFSAEITRRKVSRNNRSSIKSSFTYPTEGIDTTVVLSEGNKNLKNTVREKTLTVFNSSLQFKESRFIGAV